MSCHGSRQIRTCRSAPTTKARGLAQKQARSGNSDARKTKRELSKTQDQWKAREYARGRSDKNALSHKANGKLGICKRPAKSGSLDCHWSQPRVLYQFLSFLVRPFFSIKRLPSPPAYHLKLPSSNATHPSIYLLSTHPAPSDPLLSSLTQFLTPPCPQQQVTCPMSWLQRLKTAPSPRTKQATTHQLWRVLVGAAIARPTLAPRRRSLDAGRRRRPVLPFCT